MKSEEKKHWKAICTMCFFGKLWTICDIYPILDIPPFFDIFPNDALSVDYSRPRQESARFLQYINSHVIVINRYVLPHLRTKQNTNMGMVQSLRKNIS